MPNRILKESICTSENIDQLTPFQETFFYRLMVNCDDFGRMDARGKILAARLFPLKDIKESQIRDCLRALVAAGLIFIYEVDDHPYLQMKTWEKHQQVRAKRSKYPSADESNCNQMISNDIKCPRNPIQSESNPNPNTNRETQKRFTPPTQEEVEAYCKERGNGIDAEYFINYYQKQDWFLSNGRKMKDWKAAIITWEKNNSSRGNNQPKKTVTAQQYTQRDYSGEQEDAMQRMLKLQEGA